MRAVNWESFLLTDSKSSNSKGLTAQAIDLW